MSTSTALPGVTSVRKRSASRSRIDQHLRLVRKTILAYQHPITGLLSSNFRENRHAWIRDNVYGILSVWALSTVYRKFADYDEDRQVAYELESSVCKLMRGLLRCMMLQSPKVEAFKYTQNVRDSLHAKYDSTTYQTVVGDAEWGHLQIDAVSLYVLVLAQLTASGMQIVYTLDEVDFVQNLVFYIEAAYRIPDYGVWERGDKTNHGLPELNSSSIGIAKAALEAINELDLFGPRGSPASVVHAMPDEVQQCRAVLASMLPRESNSKELDSALLSVISFPAFAIDSAELIERTRDDIIQKLQGRFGCKRFLRDGYKTPYEDVQRLHYEPWELKAFELIECEWPLFLTYLIIDAHFEKNEKRAKLYSDMLERVLISENGVKLVPELYAVRREQVEAEKRQPGSQDRVALGKIPHIWSQSLYIISGLLNERLLAPEDLDPLNRRLSTELKPEVVVQVVILAESSEIQGRIAAQGVSVQTFAEVSPIRVYPSRVLGQFYRQLGKNSKLGLTGRASSDVGVLATSKFYQIADDILAFSPQFLDPRAFYLTLDIDLMLEMLRNELVFLRKTWSVLGRPTLIIPVMSWMLPAQTTASSKAPLVAVLRKLLSGYYGGTRVQLGNLRDFISTSCVTKLTFLADEADRDTIMRQMRTYADRGARIKRLSGERGRKRVMAWRNMRFSIQRSVDGTDSGVKIALERRASDDNSDGNPTNYVSRPEAPASRYESVDESHEDDVVGELNVTSSTPRRRRISLFVREMLTGSRESNESLKSAGTTGDSTNIAAPSGPVGGVALSLKLLAAVPESQMLHHLKTNTDDFTAADDSAVGGPALCSSMQYAYLHRSYMAIMSKYEKMQIHDVVEKLRVADSLGEQAELIHYLYLSKGLDFNTHIDEDGMSVCTVKDLIKELYERAGKLRQWSLVRHSSGILKKRTDDFAKTVTDLLARQKQICVGMPPEPREKLIAAPLPPDQLMDLIEVACDNDPSMMMLTQEIIVYLAMIIRTQPQLFGEMLRLRTGLIIQVMVSELEHSLNCTAQDATDYLLSMTPCDVKTLLHNLLSGKEIRVRAAAATVNDEGTEDDVVASSSVPQFTFASETNLRLEGNAGQQLEESLRHERTGQWLRRRRIDGSLNRVPAGFYARVWTALEKGVSIVLSGQILSSAMTKEMTVNETKFALEVEKIMNRFTYPEYRQLVVEATMLLCTVLTSDTDAAFATKKETTGVPEDGHVSTVQQGIQRFLQQRFFSSGYAFSIDDCVRQAFIYFLEEQRLHNGDAMLCCASRPNNEIISGFSELQCRGANRICTCFYDSAPSGSFGTMTYLTRSISELITRGLGEDGIIDCQVM